jgi:hypothetical protein
MAETEFMELLSDDLSRVYNDFYENHIKIIISNLQTFIRNPTSDLRLLYRPETATEIFNYTGKTLGSGAQGTVSNIFIRDFVVKFFTCKEITKATKESCERIDNRQVYTTSYSKGGNIIYLPDPVNENVIGSILNFLSPNIPYFTKNYGMLLINQEEKKSDIKTISIIESLKTHPFRDKVKNGEDLILTIIQFLYALSVGQQMFEFTHNDSHIDNILYEDSEINHWDIFNLKICGNQSDISNIFRDKFYVKNPGWNIKINDYGLSRLRLKMNKTITNDEKEGILYNLDNVYTGVPNFPNNLTNFGKFSHCVDYLTLFGCLFYPKFIVGRKYPQFQPVKRHINKILRTDPLINRLSKILGVNPQEFFYYFIFEDKSDITNKIINTYNGLNYYRPDSNFIHGNSELFRAPDRALFELLNFCIAQDTKLVTKDLPFDINVVINKTCTKMNGIQPDSPESAKFEPKDYVPVFSNKPYKKHTLQTLFPEPGQGLSFELHQYITYTKINYNNFFKISPLSLFNNSKDCNFPQIAHIVRFNKQCQNMFKLSSQCCGMDVAEFFEDSQKFGVAINGVYFKINKDNYPIGPYKDKRNRQLRHAVPKAYQRYYGNILINDDGKLEISNVLINTDGVLQVSGDSDYISVAGPILIDTERKYEFNEQDLQPFMDVNLFTCVPINTKPPNTEKIIYPGSIIQTNNCNEYGVINNPIQINKPYLNCNTIEPGELSHGMNPNPRSILAYNDQYLYFIVIEGRLEQSKGLDFINMVKLLKTIDPPYKRL